MSISDSGKLKLSYNNLKNIYREPNIFGLDMSNSTHHQRLAQSAKRNRIRAFEIIHSKEKHPTDNLYLSGLL